MNAKVILLLVAALASSTPAYAKKRPQLTPLELQALQSKEFETSKEVLFSSVMTVFGDLGYQIDNADLQTGFITANSATINKTNFLGALAGVASSGNTRATAFIEKLGNGMARVRLNFLSTSQSSSSYGQLSRSDRPILDPAVYNVAWDKIDEALFVRQAIDSPDPNAEKTKPQTPPTDNKL